MKIHWNGWEWHLCCLIRQSKNIFINIIGANNNYNVLYIVNVFNIENFYLRHSRPTFKLQKCTSPLRWAREDLTKGRYTWQNDANVRVYILDTVWQFSFSTFFFLSPVFPCFLSLVFFINLKTVQVIHPNNFQWYHSLFDTLCVEWKLANPIPPHTISKPQPSVYSTVECKCDEMAKMTTPAWITGPWTCRSSPVAKRRTLWATTSSPRGPPGSWPRPRRLREPSVSLKVSFCTEREKKREWNCTSITLAFVVWQKVKLAFLNSVQKSNHIFITYIRIYKNPSHI